MSRSFQYKLQIPQLLLNYLLPYYLWHASTFNTLHNQHTNIYTMTYESGRVLVTDQQPQKTQK